MKGMILMNMRNLLKPGNFVMLVPVGLHLTLQYSASGNLERIYTGYGMDRVDHTDDMFNLLIKHKVVPQKIQVMGGTSWVCGVLYTGTQFAVSGLLPEVVESDLIDMFISSPNRFNFFAGTFESTAVAFRGSTAIRQCLTSAKFKLLPGWLVPYNVSNLTLDDWINSPQYTFMPVVTDYIIFQKEAVNIVSANVTQSLVKSMVKRVDYNGYVKVDVEFEDSTPSLSIDYSAVVHQNIHIGSILALDSERHIIQCRNTANVKCYDPVLTCPYCGRRYDVPRTGSVICPDIHCTSRLLPNIVQFTTTLKLPQYPDEHIRQWLKDKSVTCIPDILLLDAYKNIKIDITIADLLRSVIPTALITKDDIFITFALGCSNNIHTFKYYVEHADMIASDLHIKHIDLNKLLVWLSDGCNVSDIITLLEMPQLNFISVKKKFEGAPIFRNKTICVTGKFIHGNTNEVASILQSYSAIVTTNFSNVVDCVIVGGTREEVDGKIVRAAKSLNKPVMSEDDFFMQYDIDADLKFNLV